MHVSALYIHPIKSLLPISIQTTTLTPLGFPHDRTFILLRASTNEPLQVGNVSQLCLFSLSLSSPDTITVTFTPAGTILDIPLTPPLGEEVPVEIYLSACTGYRVSSDADTFFSTHLGFDTTLVFLGASSRPVLGNVAPPPASWLGFGKKSAESKITFADAAPLLVANQASLSEVSSRCGAEVDMRKFRPNIVVAPSADSEELEAFEEDFWGEMEVGGTKVVLTANCGRCQSINVDFETGGRVESDRQPLKKMMKDRRVDTGLKFSPVFGRYGFAVGEGEMVLSVGDEVRITKRNKERTEFYWPGVSTGTRTEN